MTPKYDHAEAFMLMKYISEKRGFGPDPIVEYLWNSRDGVTPFEISSNHPVVGERWAMTPLFHSDFRSGDRYEPYWPHVGLKAGDRIFVDMTRGRAMDWALERARKLVAADPEEILSEKEVCDIADTFMDEPDIVVVNESLLNKLRRHCPKPPVNLMGSRGSERFS